MTKNFHLVRDFLGGRSLPAVVDDCVFQTDRKLLLAGEPKQIRELGFCEGERLYPSQHSTLFQQLIVGLEDGTKFCLEMELIIGWSGQGGYPSQPWQQLVDLGRLLSREYGLPYVRRTEWHHDLGWTPE